MKILYIIHQYYPEFSGGTEKVLSGLSRMIQNTGNKVKIVTCTLSATHKDGQGIVSKTDYLYKGVPITAISIDDPPYDFNYTLENSMISNFAMELLELEKPDIVHIIHPMRLAIFSKVCTELRIPYVVTLTDFFSICPKVILSTSSGDLCAGPGGGVVCKSACPELPIDMVKNRLESSKYFLRNAKKVFAPSNFLADVYQSEISNLEITVLPHGISQSGYTMRNRVYKGSEDKLVVGFVGGSNHHKGLHILLNAFRTLSATNIKLKIYGLITEEFSRKFRRDISTDNRIEICGEFTNEQAKNIYSQFDLVIIPSICYESYSLTLHESYISNIPVIASNVGVFTEKIRHEENGFLFKVGQSDHLSSVIQSICNNPVMLNSIKKEMSKDWVSSIEQEAYVYERTYRYIAGISNGLL